ncbi:MAG: division/cell wall cluster transcriptional repressor MraZ [Deltaproteobacteria bacterium]|nr:division/cell wall cluster transcriptional repressor MraZ [Deltaproteobacteria bacterium]
MFRGRFTHTMDTKGRMSIPSGFRTELERRSQQAPILTTAYECLHLYPVEDWCEVERNIVDRATEDLDAQAYQRMMLSGATECPIDKQGRVLVPQYLRDHAGIEREVTIAGVGPRIEFWDKSRFDADLLKTQARFSEISSKMSGLKRKES